MVVIYLVVDYNRNNKRRENNKMKIHRETTGTGKLSVKELLVIALKYTDKPIKLSDSSVKIHLSYSQYSVELGLINDVEKYDADICKPARASLQKFTKNKFSTPHHETYYNSNLQRIDDLENCRLSIIREKFGDCNTKGISFQISSQQMLMKLIK